MSRPTAQPPPGNVPLSETAWQAATPRGICIRACIVAAAGPVLVTVS